MRVIGTVPSRVSLVQNHVTPEDISVTPNIRANAISVSFRVPSVYNTSINYKHVLYIKYIENIHYYYFPLQ